MFAFRRTAAIVSRRTFATSTAPPPKEVNLMMEIGMGLGLSFALAMVWKGFTDPQIAAIEAFNLRVKQAKKDGLL